MHEKVSFLLWLASSLPARWRDVLSLNQRYDAMYLHQLSAEDSQRRIRLQAAAILQLKATCSPLWWCSNDRPGGLNFVDLEDFRAFPKISHENSLPVPRRVRMKKKITEKMPTVIKGQRSICPFQPIFRDPDTCHIS